ncbi:hypothetical protein F444_17515, partial [Phytophthora nicotianae P1976]
MRAVSRLLVAAVAVTVTSARSLGSSSFESSEVSDSGSGSLVDDDSTLNDEGGSKIDLDDLFGSGFEAPSSSSDSNLNNLFASSSNSESSEQSDSASNEESASSLSEASTAAASSSASADVIGSESDSASDEEESAADSSSETETSAATKAPDSTATEAPVATEAPAPAISVEDSVQLSESIGGPHGNEFSDEAAATAGQTVGSITIRSGERVDGVSLNIKAPTATTFTHGGTGGDANTLSIGVDEYITSMEAHWGKKNDHTRIFYLSFGTSKGNTISGGTKTAESKSVTAPEGFQLGGFFGRGGDEIDMLGAIWTSIAPVADNSTPQPATPSVESTSASASASTTSSDASEEAESASEE